MVTRALQKAFFGLFDGTTADRYGWLTTVSPADADATTRPAGVEMEAA